MKLNFKKISLTIALSSIMVFSLLPISASAATESQNTYVMPVSVETSDMHGLNSFVLTPEDSGITQQMTWVGNFGVSSLNYIPKARAFNWWVAGPTWPTHFAGKIDIYTASTKKYRGTIVISGQGLGLISGNAKIGGFKLSKNTSYIAYYSGVAKSYLHTARIVRGASIHFVYK